MSKKYKIISFKNLFVFVAMLLLFVRSDFNRTVNFNPKTFLPDRYVRSRFPWEDVIACMNDTLVSDDFIKQKECPNCGTKSEDLIWVEFRSPKYTWEQMCGRAGPLSICNKCNIQVEFIVEMMN